MPLAAMPKLAAPDSQVTTPSTTGTGVPRTSRAIRIEGHRPQRSTDAVDDVTGGGVLRVATARNQRAVGAGCEVEQGNASCAVPVLDREEQGLPVRQEGGKQVVDFSLTPVGAW